MKNTIEKKHQRILVLLAAGLLATGALGLHLLLDHEGKPMLERALDSGVLVVAVQHKPSSLYDGPNGPDGFEHALSRRFAEALNVDIRYIVSDDIKGMTDSAASAQAHFATGLTITDARDSRVDFSEPYHYVTEQIVYKRGNHRPRSPEDIRPGDLHVAKGSSHEETLDAIRQKSFPNLSWQSHEGIGNDHLIADVDQGDLRLTMANSIDLALQRRIHTRAARAFQVGDPRPIAWAFPKRSDQSLLRAANRFLQSLEQNGELERLRASYFGHTGRLNFVDVREFWRHVRDRLPTLQAYFKLAEEQTGIDWRLLAAIGYQESHWLADAVSPTGVRGIMMLTQTTAEQMSVDDRNDPKQSILGGARYLRVIDAKMPERITQPDRLWMTLAGYNVGFGHLEDARILTQRDGANADLWLEVKQRLPLLAKKEYYKTLRYGYARGREPVNYVENIRNYYDLLLWFTTTSDQQTRQRLLAKNDTE